MPNMLPILTHPNPLLRRKAEPVPVARIKEENFQTFLDDLSHTMIHADGIGLAALQVGSLADVVVLNTDDGPLHLINARITSFGKKQAKDTEACLSVPGFAGTVKRALNLKMNFIDREGHKQQFTAEGLWARVVQHELDHQQGILYIDRAESVWRKEPKTGDRAV